jgi:hypothetical protein
MRKTLFFWFTCAVLIGSNFVKAYADCWELVWADEFNGTSLDTS